MEMTELYPTSIEEEEKLYVVIDSYFDYPDWEEINSLDDNKQHKTSYKTKAHIDKQHVTVLWHVLNKKTGQ